MTQATTVEKKQRRKEIYARGAVQLRTHERALHAEELCPGAMGMYFFLLLQARGEETDGDARETVALASWGGGVSAPLGYRRRQLGALLEVGLVERMDGGRVLVVRYEEHNDVRAVIEANREAARRRQNKVRHGDASEVPEAPLSRVTNGVTHGVTHASVTISSFNSLSESSSGSEDPDSSPRAEEHRFAAGTASAEAARQAYAAAVSEVTGASYAFGRAPFDTVDLCELLNAHGPPGAALPALAWLRTTIAEWVAALGGSSPGGFRPRKLADWLNGKRPSSGAKAPFRDACRQPVFDDDPWMHPLWGSGLAGDPQLELVSPPPHGPDAAAPAKPTRKAS